MKPKRRGVYIITEAGVNHNGNLRLAKKLVDVAAKAGADAVKFQTFSASSLVTRLAPRAPYQKLNTRSRSSQLSMLKELELDLRAHNQLIKHCNNRGITFLSSPFDINGVKLLKKLNLRLFKIPSGELTNLPLLKEVGKLKKEVILSTGMSNISEIKDALRVLISSGTKKRDITLLQCNSSYPTPYADANLNAMLTLKETFGVDVGYSDHTQGVEVAIAAAALGAVVIEKHFTLDKAMEGPDHKASLNPEELLYMVAAIRNIESALGSGKKSLSASESKNKKVARKSIVAAKNIKKGEILSTYNITTKRPEGGLSPMSIKNIIGTASIRDFREDEFIEV